MTRMLMIVMIAAAVLLVGEHHCLADEAGGQPNGFEAAVERLAAASQVSPRIRISSLGSRVREMIGRCKIEPGGDLPGGVEAFLKEHNDAFGIWARDTDLRFTGRETLPHITTLDYQLLYKGVPVWADTVEVQVDKDNVIVVIINRTGPVPELEIDPKVGRDDVVKAVEAEWKKFRDTDMPQCGAELVVYEGKLAYLIKMVEGETTYGFVMDANNASMIHAFKNKKDPMSEHCVM